MPPPGEPPILPLMPASLILINGASSAGKTTLCRAVRDAMPAPFLHFSLDFFMFGANVLPRTLEGKIRDWPHLRPHVFQGFNRCLPALLDAGNNLVVDYIIETPAMWAEFGQFLHGHDVFLIGLHCPAEELERREQVRADRRAGDARRDAETVHTFTHDDLELDCTEPLAENVQKVIRACENREGQPFGGAS